MCRSLLVRLEHIVQWRATWEHAYFHTISSKFKSNKVGPDVIRTDE